MYAACSDCPCTCHRVAGVAPGQALHGLCGRRHLQVPDRSGHEDEPPPIRRCGPLAPLVIPSTSSPCGVVNVWFEMRNAFYVDSSRKLHRLVVHALGELRQVGMPSPLPPLSLPPLPFVPCVPCASRVCPVCPVSRLTHDPPSGGHALCPAQDGCG